MQSVRQIYFFFCLANIAVLPFPIMKPQQLHLKKLEKEIKKLEKKHVGVSNKNNLIIASDSKGRFLRNQMSFNTHLNIQYRSGAKVNNNQLKSIVFRKIQSVQHPIVALWFGTCELTTKDGDFISLTTNIETKITDIITQYKELKREIITRNNRSKVIFLECPYFSLLEWNKHKNHPNPDLFSEQQKILEASIDKLNKEMQSINGNIRRTRISQDMVFSTKCKGKSQKYSIDYSLLKDGIHPGEVLTKLWLLKINSLLSDF